MRHSSSVVSLRIRCNAWEINGKGRYPSTFQKQQTLHLEDLFDVSRKTVALDKLFSRSDVKGFQNPEEFCEVRGSSWELGVIITGVTITWPGNTIIDHQTDLCLWRDELNKNKSTKVWEKMTMISCVIGLWQCRPPPPIMSYVTPITKYGFLDNKVCWL